MLLTFESLLMTARQALAEDATAPALPDPAAPYHSAARNARYHARLHQELRQAAAAFAGIPDADYPALATWIRQHETLITNCCVRGGRSQTAVRRLWQCLHGGPCLTLHEGGMGESVAETYPRLV